MSTEITQESERSWFYEQWGCTPGCSLPFALIMVLLASVFLDSAFSAVSLRDRLSGAAPSGVVDGTEGFDSFSGKLAADAPLGDALLRPGPFVHIERHAEVYAWSEIVKREQGRVERDGSRRVASTYRYGKGWTNLIVPKTFHDPRGQENPKTHLESARLWAEGAALGGRRLPTGQLLGSQGGEPFEPSAGELQPGVRFEGGYVYRGRGTPSSPEIGDERATYRVLRAGRQATFFGKIEGERLGPMPLASSPRCVLRLGSPRQASARARADLAKDAWSSCALAWLLAWGGLQVALAAILIWTQRSSLSSLRRAAHVVLGILAGVGSLLLVGGGALALQLGAPGEVVLLGTPLLALAGLLAFRWAATRAREAAERSWLGWLILG